MESNRAPTRSLTSNCFAISAACEMGEFASLSSFEDRMASSQSKTILTANMRQKPLTNLTWAVFGPSIAISRKTGSPLECARRQSRRPTPGGQSGKWHPFDLNHLTLHRHHHPRSSLSETIQRMVLEPRKRRTQDQRNSPRVGQCALTTVRTPEHRTNIFGCRGPELPSYPPATLPVPFSHGLFPNPLGSSDPCEVDDRFVLIFNGMHALFPSSKCRFKIVIAHATVGVQKAHMQDRKARFVHLLIHVTLVS